MCFHSNAVATTALHNKDRWNINPSHSKKENNTKLINPAVAPNLETLFQNLYISG